MLSQLQVVSHQERNKGLAVKTKLYKSLKTQPQIHCCLGWQSKRSEMEVHKLTGLWHRNPHFDFQS